VTQGLRSIRVGHSRFTATPPVFEAVRESTASDAFAGTWRAQDTADGGQRHDVYDPPRRRAMNTETAGRHAKASPVHKGTHHHVDASATVDSILPIGSWQRLAAGVTAAAAGGLLAAAMVGVGPASIAGAAGYLAYRGMKEKKEGNGHKH
jgi:hypothetical protein